MNHNIITEETKTEVRPLISETCQKIGLSGEVYTFFPSKFLQLFLQEGQVP
jgi:hypothetical protein